MTTATAPKATGISPSSRAAITALVRFEGRKMLTHPLLWVGALAAIVLSVLELRVEAPVLNRVSVMLAWTMLPLAAAVALIAGWAVYRAKGQTDAHPPHVLPIPMGQRVGAIVIALLYPALLVLVLHAGLLAWIMTRDPVTEVVWAELLAGPLYLIMAGAMAAAMTRWLPHPSTPLLTVLVLAVAMAVTYPSWQEWGSSVGFSWLAPLPWPHDNIPYEVNFRPIGLHLAYLGALIAVVAMVSILRRTPGSLITLTGVAVLAVVLGLTQLGPVPESWRQESISRLIGDGSEVSCEVRGGVQYCALPGYEGWIDRWEAAVDPVVQAAPSEVVAGLELRQYPIPSMFVPSGAGLDRWFSGWWWMDSIRADLDQRPHTHPLGTIIYWESGHLMVAANVTTNLLGCEDTCEGESQQLVYFWLMANHPEVRASLEASEYPTGASCMARDLLDTPGAADLIHDNWALFTNEATSYHQAADLLGVTVPELGVNEWGQETARC